MGNLIARKIEGGRDLSGLRRWSCQRFRGKGEASPRIETLYITLPPAIGGGSGSVYAQNLTHYHNINTLQCPRGAFLKNLGKEIELWKEKVDQIILIGDINKYTLGHNIRGFMANMEQT